MLSSKILSRILCLCVWLMATLSQIAQASSFNLVEQQDSVEINTDNYLMTIDKAGFRYAFAKPDGSVWLGKHADSGLIFLNSSVVTTELLEQDKQQVVFKVTNELGIEARVTVTPSSHYLKMAIALQDEGELQGSILARTAGLSPAYGLGDHAARRKSQSTEVSGYSSRHFGALTDGKPSRLTSNFVIFPSQKLALVSVEPDKKIVKVTRDELAQGVEYGASIPALYYFFGEPEQIYADFKTVRDQEGYKVYAPKYEWFGVGWEAWGALAWDTNEQTIRHNVDQYLQLGFPLDWMVVGSGFWPKKDPTFLSTTSFGLWDKTLYPNPEQMIEYFHNKGLKLILGLRIAFIPNGPFTQEGLDKGYFIKKDGKARLFRVSFPKPESYFLDANNPAAVDWYIELCKKWLSSGVDGFKEDLFGYEIEGLPDNKLDPVNAKLMEMGAYVMGRNGYLGSPMDLHRFEDFNYDQNQDRGPINGLAFAYSGFPYVYPDIVAGKGLHNMEFGEFSGQQLRTYFIRNARYASMNPSMSFGYGVWNLNDQHTTDMVRDAALDHHRLQPFIYSAAIRTYRTGFPYTMTPLPLAFPDDAKVHGRENNRVRGYQWLINDTLLAYPLYGDDYASSNSRDLYLPAGKWIDYDDGTLYQGPKLLKNFAIPLEKTPLFVGGSGVVVEQQDNALVGRLYATGFTGKVPFFGKDGVTQSVIDIKHPVGKSVTVTDTHTQQQVEVTRVRHAYQFRFIAGHNYVVE